MNTVPGLRAAVLGEFVGTAFLLIAVVGSGIAAERLSQGNVGLALLANSLSTAGALFALILVFAPISGAHLNPAVTIASALVSGFAWRGVPFYIAAQIAGAVGGTWVAHGMFGVPLLEISTHVRTGPGQWLAEAVATSGLLGVIWGCSRYGTPIVAAAVAAYIGGAYWFSASSSFANPAATMARSLTDTFTGIRPVDVPGFILAQLGAVIIAVLGLRGLRRTRTPLS